MAAVDVPATAPFSEAASDIHGDSGGAPSTTPFSEAASDIHNEHAAVRVQPIDTSEIAPFSEAASEIHGDSGSSAAASAIAPISEAASQKKKQKRGRPTAFSDQLVEIVCISDPESHTKTRRHRVNLAYRQWAISILGKQEQFAWLCDVKKMAAAQKNSWKPSILVELGRFWPNEAEMIEEAELICNLRPKTKQAISMIRQDRLGGKRKGNCLDLANAITKLIDDYSLRHAMTAEQILMALENVRGAVEFGGGRMMEDE
jgi:hypothetical protein